MKYTLTLFLFFLCLNLFSQVEQRKNFKNAIYAEIDYNSDLDFYSILYDRMLKTKGFVKIGFQTGLTLSSQVVDGNGNWAKFYPLRSYFLFGNNQHYFETDFGFKLLGFVFPECQIAYRYINNKNGLSCKIGYNGIIMIYAGLENMISLSCGYSF